MISSLRAVLAPLLLSLTLSATPALAVEPDEVLPDPEMEARARVISRDLRCLVCRNESIDESNADLARDLRLLVRERLVAGDSNDEVIEFVVDRYGEYVLLRPLTTGSNMILWIAGPAMLVIGMGVAVIYLRRRRHAVDPVLDPLNASEEDRIKELLKD